MSNKTKLLRTSLIGVSGAASAAIAAGVVAVLTLVPMPSYSGQPPQFTLNPEAGSISEVCPGALSILASQPGISGFYAPGSVEIQTSPEGSSVQRTTLGVSNSVASDDHGYVLSLRAEAAKEGLTTTQFELAQTEELAGAAALACTTPSNDFWLVGGSTEVGRTSLLVLSNPSEVSATVTIETFDESGYVTQQAEPILVEPQQQTLVSLAGYLPESTAPVVRVQSVGGQITAFMQQSTTRTLMPSGVDWIAAGPGPATDAVITGVALSGQSEHDRSEVGDVVSDLEPALRLVAPGEKDTKVNVVIRDTEGKTEKYTANLKARQVAQLPLPVKADGLYTLEIHAAQPIVASVRTIQDYLSTDTSPVSSAGGDFTWISSNKPLPDQVTVAVPESISSYLSIYNPSNKDMIITMMDGSGEEQTLTIAAHVTQKAPVLPQSNYVLTGVKGMYATLVFEGNGLGSAMAITPGEGAAASIDVYPR